MDLVFEKVRPFVTYVGEQVLVGIVLAFHVTVFALLTIPESISSATSLGGLVWDQLSSPSPHAPAGDLTFRLFRIWTNHVVDVEIPRFRSLAARFDGELALSFRSLEQRSLSLRIPLPVDRASVQLGESKTQGSLNRQDVIVIDILDASSRSSPWFGPTERKAARRDALNIESFGSQGGKATPLDPRSPDADPDGWRFLCRISAT
jgi:hypothetical protein